MGTIGPQESKRRSVIFLLVFGLGVMVLFGVLTLLILRDASPPKVTGRAVVLMREPTRVELIHATNVLVGSRPAYTKSEDAARYTVVACGPSPTTVALVLAGDAQLDDVRVLERGTRIRTVNVPEGPLQVISARIPAFPCIGNSYSGAGTEIFGRWRRSFKTVRNGQGAFAFPRIGSPADSVGRVVLPGKPFPGLSGRWIYPPNLRVEVEGPLLGPDDRIDLAKPDTTGPTALYWRSRGFVWPFARWTNLGVAARNQLFVILFSVLIGVGASLFAAGLQRTVESPAWRLPRFERKRGLVTRQRDGQGASRHDDRMPIELDFSKIPGDVALLLSQQQHTRDLADDLAGCMSLKDVDRELLHQEIVGAVAAIVDEYLAGPKPR